MRFSDIREFDINDLSLDQGNYRFRKASDQRQCIEKIFQLNQQNFKNIMINIAEKDIGEVLLVYQDPEGDYVVMDGNRRTSALKVLLNPDLAPSESIKKKAINLSKEYNIKPVVQGQISKDKDRILRTIHERHSSSGGTSRIPWAAMAKSRFSYDNNFEMPETEWKVIALLFKFEEIDPKLTRFFESKDYKHDVFRRIVSAAIKNGVISSSVFSDRNEKIYKSKTKLIKEAHKVCSVFFEDIKNGVIGLKRSSDNIYADLNGVSKYLEKFIPSDKSDCIIQKDVSEDNTPKVDLKNSNNNLGEHGASLGNDVTKSEDSSSSSNVVSRSSSNGVNYSKELDLAISKIRSGKFKQLYNSICIVSLKQHPSLVMIGAWALVESIASALANTLGENNSTSIDGYFSRGRIKDLWPDQFQNAQIKDFTDALKFIREEANSNKHSPEYYLNSAENLKVRFDCLNKLLIKAVEKISIDNT